MGNHQRALYKTFRSASRFTPFLTGNRQFSAYVTTRPGDLSIYGNGVFRPQSGSTLRAGLSHRKRR